MSGTDLSVIIPVYNGEALISRCLDSVRNQQTSYTWEVLVVDDGSTDRSVEVIENYHDPRFRVLRQQNAGPSKARNRGVLAAQGRYVAFLDADDYWQDSYIQQTVRFLDAHDTCVAVSVVCENRATGQSQVSYNPSSFSQGEGVCDEQGNRTAEPFVIHDFYAYWARECHVGTCSTTIKTEEAWSVLMREDLRVSEDYEYWLLLATRGQWGLIPEPLYVSDGGAVTATQGWVNKMKKRWDNAPAIAEWEKRILTAKPDLAQRESYRYAIGRVSRNLSYCQLLSGRIKLALDETRLYGAYYTRDTIGKLMKACRYSWLTWWLLCKLLQFREYHRKL